MPFIKAAAITNLADARYFASYGAKMMGFCFDPKSPHYIQPYKMQEISGWLQGPEFVGEFNNLSIDAITDLVQSLSLQYAQLPLQQIDKALNAHFPVPLIIELGINKNNLPLQETLHQLDTVYQPDDFILLQLQTLTIDDLQNEEIKLSIKKIASKYPAIIDYPFNSNNIHFFLKEFSVEGIALHGLPEVKIGTKDFESLNELMDVLVDNN